MKYCIHCQSEYEKNITVCPSCGSNSYKYKCTKCGNIYNKTVLCPNCDVDSRETPTPPKREKKMSNPEKGGMTLVDLIVILAIIGVISALVILLLSEGGFSNIGNDKPDSAGRITMPKTSQGYQGENYHNVVAELQRRGFTNIIVVGTGDLMTDFFNKPDTVKSVSVAGNTDYKTGTRYSTDVKIVITYHSLSKFAPPWVGKSFFKEVRKCEFWVIYS